MIPERSVLKKCRPIFYHKSRKTIRKNNHWVTRSWFPDFANKLTRELQVPEVQGNNIYLRPIINGIGNYYIESRTRNKERTDVIVDYGGEQFVIELKIWR